MTLYVKTFNCLCIRTLKNKTNKHGEKRKRHLCVYFFCRIYEMSSAYISPENFTPSLPLLYFYLCNREFAIAVDWISGIKITPRSTLPHAYVILMTFKGLNGTWFHWNPPHITTLYGLLYDLIFLKTREKHPSNPKRLSLLESIFKPAA